jgi:hypothetical protein
MNDHEAEGLLPWTPPVLELLGNLLDAGSNVGGDMDIDGLNEDPILMS